MTESQWTLFSSFRTRFKERCQAWNSAFGELLPPLQKAAAEKDTPPYPIETPVVYNQALDDIQADSLISYIVIGDNPGKDEQRSQNRRYLVGQSGKIAQGFFARNPALQTDFRKNVIILNKTPVHTAKTVHLRFLMKNGGEKIQELIAESTRWMAEETAKLHRGLYEAAHAAPTAPATPDAGEKLLLPELWLVGYTELKDRGIFSAYRDTLKAAYSSKKQTAASDAWQAVRVFRHFSMNQFTTELNKVLATSSLSIELPADRRLIATLRDIGLAHRAAIFKESPALL